MAIDPKAQEFKEKIAAELRKPGMITQDSLSKAIVAVVEKEKELPASDMDRHSLDIAARGMAEELYFISALSPGGKEALIAHLDTMFERVEKREGSQLKSNLANPYIGLAGTVGGGAIGLAAASMAGIGDWTSFSGIVKKLLFITAGIVAGNAIAGGAAGVHAAIVDGNSLTSGLSENFKVRTINPKIPAR